MTHQRVRWGISQGGVSFFASVSAISTQQENYANTKRASPTNVLWFDRGGKLCLSTHRSYPKDGRGSCTSVVSASEVSCVADMLTYQQGKSSNLLTPDSNVENSFVMYFR
jgi:hypothetical protein